MAESYYKNMETQAFLKLRDLQRELPPFATDFFVGIADYISATTRLGYAYDLKIFFMYLNEEVLHKDNIRNCTTEDIANLEAKNIENFMDYLTYYLKQNDYDESEIAIQNTALGKSRKLAAVRTMFKYLFSKSIIPSNPAELVSFPKIREKTITTLEANEIAQLLDLVESGEKLTKKQLQYHLHTKIRDVAIITVMLGTGLRVSECVGLDILDVDFESYGLKVTRKGGDEMLLYFGQEVAEALQTHLEIRREQEAKLGHEKALFLSIQNRRITERAVQNLVKKYSTALTTLKTISPHKLRSTFGTQLYKETGDIYLVANVLGHADVNTTRKHYAKMDEEKRRQAAEVVKLRQD